VSSLLFTEINFWTGAARTSKLLKVRNELQKNWGNAKNSGENGKQHVEMVLDT
jgi:hypothetical protein